MVESKAFFTIGKGLIPMRASLEPWGHLEVVVKHVVEPKDAILNGFVTYAHISGSNPTPMSSFFYFFYLGYLMWLGGMVVIFPTQVQIPSSDMMRYNTFIIIVVMALCM